VSLRVNLFTGQWADLPLEELAGRTVAWGFDGLELACWGDHFEVDRAVSEADSAGASARCSTATGSAAGPSTHT
jgi:sugar phosphate isomerase/epimerase